MAGSVVMAVSQLIAAIVGVAASSHAANQCLVAFSCIFIAGFCSNLGTSLLAICRILCFERETEINLLVYRK